MDILSALLRGSNRISHVFYLGANVLLFHGRKSAIEGFFVRRERVAYTGGFHRMELLAMKRRGRNSSTCPRIFRERRKVALTILYEVISFLSYTPCSSFFLCLSLLPPIPLFIERTKIGATVSRKTATVQPRSAPALLVPVGHSVEI